MLFTWNLAPPRSSCISPEYLLLPPRSAPVEATEHVRTHPSEQRLRPLTRSYKGHKIGRAPDETLKRHPFSGSVDSAGELLHTP